ncbi:TPA: hypothetical protein IAA87_07565 [Candidatus Avigastranaerophilus faecigallinarum]|nr:hypothetical protein [Candidatus Avigastranaerophilus faecigallinarum]
MANISKIRECRELIKLDNLLLHDRPIELTSAQIDYLLSAGFEGHSKRNSFIFKDKHLEIEYLIVRERENNE